MSRQSGTKRGKTRGRSRRFWEQMAAKAMLVDPPLARILGTGEGSWYAVSQAGSMLTQLGHPLTKTNSDRLVWAIRRLYAGRTTQPPRDVVASRNAQ